MKIQIINIIEHPLEHAINLATFYLYGWLVKYTNHKITYVEINLKDDVSNCKEKLINADLNLVSLMFQSHYFKYNQFKDLLSGRIVIGGGFALYISDKEAFKGSSEVWCEKEFNISGTERQLIIPPNASIGNAIAYPNGYGCNWGKCNYCNYVKQNPVYVEISKDIMEKELLYLYNHEKLKNIVSTRLFMTAERTSPKQIEIIEDIISKIDKITSWFYYFRGDNSWKKLKNNCNPKCQTAFIGIEIFDNAGMQILNKNTTEEQIANSIEYLTKERKNATLISVGIMTHLPIEDYETAKTIISNSLKNFKKYESSIGLVACSKLVLFPGTDLFEKYARPKGVTEPCFATYSPKLQRLWDNYNKEIKSIFKDRLTDFKVYNNINIKKKLCLF